MSAYLAIDIGASSGRHILGHLENGKLVYEEIHRFPNGMVTKGDELCWDLDTLFGEIIHGMKRCKELGKIPVSVGIDTWGVDFVLLDKHGSILGNTVAYRDNRTQGMDSQTKLSLYEEELYHRTGIQKQLFNTIYQLMAVKRDTRQLLDRTEKLLLIPDYLHYRLTGAAKTEYTNATTTGLVNAESKNWDSEILDFCGYPKNIFCDIVPSGTVLGSFTKEIQELVGFDCKVILPATHDTGSAVMAVPTAEENTLYISSGTWSLMGVENKKPNCSGESRALNFTNEGGYDYRYRYLKNIMGLWMIQSVRHELGDAYSFAELCALAEKESIPSIVKCNDSRFLSPKSMINEIQEACMEENQPLPKEAGELAAVIYNSLAECYHAAVLELERLTDTKYPAIHIVGGGANADYLNKLTAKVTGKTVYAGPSEATAIGNLMAQMIADGALSDLKSARECIRNSFEVQVYHS